ncbi:toll/interleukin-1 receptor domain-containing protein [Flexithrix dorotheae]|uniref:toll/interleukin-1 receptor domain-containing protein n=1 Tax=Flexithrix dorotheae TaxID=70993 RepID=UPI000365729B|nr:TIR domain-containing protein [Flexithrix dorotheae]
MSFFKDVFISYGRKESLSFAGRLHQQLKLQGYDCWFDKVNIPDGDDYALRIKHGIESAHNFVYIMAPRSLTSPYCLLELEYARLLGKRVIPMNQMVGFDIDIRELTQEEIATLNRFYHEFQLPNPNLKSTQDVRDRSIALIGKTDWLDAKEELEKEDCIALSEWAMQYENHWHKHENVDFLSPLKLPLFGKGIDRFDSILERLTEVLEREKSFVIQHTEILQKALDWKENQKQTNYLAVGEERKLAMEWLLQPFTGGRQIPATPSVWHCEFIMESRKNAENLMTDVFICCSSKDKSIKDNIVNTLSRYGITTWNYERDIRKGEDYHQAILRGIEEADNFMLFISPDAMSSLHCYKEYQYALQYQKRIIPLLIKPTDAGIKGFENFPKLTNIQYVNFTDNVIEEDYHRDIDEILNFLKQDEKYFEEHKQLLTKAIKWEKNQQKSVFLLRGFNLENAQTWLRINEKRAQNAPTALHKSFIKASSAAKGSLATEVFISYSRKDSDFARQVNNALQEAGKTTWFDQESIATGADFQAEIYKGISSSDNFLFIISPDAVDSPYCADEVAYAAEHNKRFMSILYKKTDESKLPASLAKVQWLDFEGGDFSKRFVELIQAIEIDQEHAHQHTVLQQRATEWEENDRSSDFLLNQSAFTNANAWLEKGKGKIPLPTTLQKEYILKSEEAIKAAEAKERAIENRLKKRLRIAGAALGIAVLFILVAVYFGWQSYNSGEEAKDALNMAELEKERAKQEQQKAENARDHLALKQQELEQEKQAALNAKDFAEVKRIEAEQAKLIAEEEKEKQRLVLKKFKASSVFSRLQLENLVEQDPTLTFNLMNWVYKEIKEDDAVVKKGLYDTYKNQTFYRSLKSWKGWRHTSIITSVSISPNGKQVLTGSFDNTAKLWDLEGNELQTFEGHSAIVKSVCFSPDGKYVLTGSNDYTAILWDLQGHELQKFKGHNDCIFSIDFSPNGKYIITGSWDNTAKLWDLNGKVLQTFSGHTDHITSVSFSPFGKYILTGSFDNTAKLWDLAGKELQTFIGHDYGDQVSCIWSVSFSPDGKKVLTGASDNTAKLWDLSGKELQTFTGHNRGEYGSSVNSVAFSPDGRNVLTGGDDNTARMWDLEGNEVQKFIGHPAIISSVNFSPNGKIIITGSEDKTAKLWTLDGQEIHKFRGHVGRVESVSFSPNGKKMLTGSADHTAKLWDLYGNILQTFSGHIGEVNSVVFSPDGKQILTGSTDKTARLWDLSGNELKTFKGHTDGITSVSFSPSGKQILTGSADKTAILWDLSGNKLKTFKGHTDGITSIDFSPGGKQILTGSADKTAKLWDFSGNELLSFKSHTDGITSVSFSPSGKQILTGSTDKTAKLWDLEGKELRTFSGHTSGIASAVFSNGGGYLVTGSWDSTAKLWDLEGNEIKTFTGHSGSICSVAFSSDRSWLLTGSEDYTAKLWSLSGQELQKFQGHKDQVTSVAFSPDGKYTLTSSHDKTANLWDINGNMVQSFIGHKAAVSSVSFSPSGKNILTGSYDGTVKLWNLEGNEIKTFEVTDEVTSLCFSPDGNYILTGGADKTVKLWDLKGIEQQVFTGHDGEITCVAFSPTGQNILTSSWDNTVKLWDLQGNELRTLNGHIGDGKYTGVFSVCFSPDGRQILTAGMDNVVKLWDLWGNELQSFSGHTRGDFSSGVYTVSFSPDGSQILTGGADKTVRLWDLSGNELKTFKGHHEGVASVCFSPDGKYILSGSGDKTAKLWKPKMNLEDYIKRGNYDRLTEAQIREYGLLDEY